MTPRAVLASLPPFASAPPPMPIPVSMSVAAAVGGGGGGVGGPPGVQPSHALHRDTAAMNQEARIPILDGPPPHTNAGGPAFTTRTHTPTAAALRHRAPSSSPSPSPPSGRERAVPRRRSAAVAAASRVPQQVPSRSAGVLQAASELPPCNCCSI